MADPTSDEWIDWTEIGQKPERFSLELLSQYSASGIDPYTVRMGQLMGKQFKLSVHGQRSIGNALGNLGVYGAAHESALKPGFGLKSIIRNSRFLDGANEIVSLCGTLLEYYGEELAAEILHSLAKALSAPPELTPMLRQWKTLTHALNGILVTSDFSEELDFFGQLSPPQNVTIDGDEPTSSVDPKSIAEALRVLGQVSHGKRANMSVVGAESVVWLAAICKWLFDMKIELRSEHGEILYSNCEGDVKPQITLAFAAESSTDKKSQPADAGNEIFHLDVPSSSAFTRPRVTFSGRTPMDLRRIFGQPFQKLFNQEAKAVGSAVGSAVRILHELVSISDGEVGSALIEKATEVLRTQYIARPMEAAMKVTFHDARTTYWAEMARLRRHCRCQICGKSHTVTPASTSPNAEGTRGLHAASFCHVVLVTMYISLILALSRMTFTEFHPKRGGMILFYERQVQKQLSARNDPDLHDLARFMHQYGEILNPKVDYMLEIGLEIFSGVPVEAGATQGFLGMSHEGIFACDYRLESPSVSGRQPGNIRIAPGKIEYQGKTFDSLRDSRIQRYKRKTLPESLEDLKLAPSGDRKPQVRENGAELILLS